MAKETSFERWKRLRWSIEMRWYDRTGRPVVLRTEERWRERYSFDDRGRCLRYRIQLILDGRTYAQLQIFNSQREAERMHGLVSQALGLRIKQGAGISRYCDLERDFFYTILIAAQKEVLFQGNECAAVVIKASKYNIVPKVKS